MKNIKTKHLILLLAVAINILVLINNILHDPGIGYDAQAHLDYVYVMPFHLPGPDDTSEFFSAPLAYFLPSITNLLAPEILGISDTENINGRTGQFANFLLSIGITILLIKICNQIAPGKEHYKISSLFFFGILPVYYKTFVQVRGEPYVVFFTFLIIYQIIIHIKNQHTPPFKDGIYLGLSLGLSILSRQWGFLLFPAVALLIIPLYIQNKILAIHYFKMITTSFVVAFLVGGWFYIHLINTFGTVTAFNREEQTFSFSNQPASFYRNTGLRDFLLFKTPTRNVFNNYLIPVFYSEVWGDYWGFFVFIKDKVPFYGIYGNKAEITPYLGRVNLVSIFPSFLLGGGY